MKTAIVEDDASSRRLLEAVVSRRGHNATSFADGSEAWAACRQGGIDLYVLDWMLPGLDGLQLCRRIRSQSWGDQVAVLVVTARTSTSDLRTILHAGATDYLAKPVDPQLLDVRLQVTEYHLTNLQRRQKAEAALQYTESRYRDLYENIPCGVYESTPSGKYVRVNPALVQMLGYSNAVELLCVDKPDLLYSNELERQQRQQALQKTGMLRNTEVRMRRKNGDSIMVLENSRAIRDSSGLVISYQGSLVDLSESSRG